ncbi:MAG: sialate O-acetylesterase [Planctomycetaceae bacterium]
MYRFLLAVLLFLSPLSAEDRSTPRATRRQAKRGATSAPTAPPLQSVDIAKQPEGLERLDLYLLLGQSNMKGRGEMPAEPSRDPGIVAMHLRDDQWYIARHPLHLTGDAQTFAGYDNAGVGPGLTFAQALRAAQPQARIGLIPCAVGGSSIQCWQPGSNRYDEAVRRARLALEQTGPVHGTIRGVLWLQGEADANETGLPEHRQRLEALIDGLRRDLQSPDLPFIACTIGEMRDERQADRARMNELLLSLPQIRPHTSCVDARDLKTHIGDAVHFDTAAQDEIGRRYAEKVLQLTGAIQAAGKVGPWNLDRLFREVPSMTWLRQDQPVHSLRYAGEDYQGHATEVFAFYASPTTLGRVRDGVRFPGVVLIHGGGGTAFADWVQLWAERGYAAIAMDLAGSRPPDPEFDPQTGRVVGHQSDSRLRTRLPNGGPNHSHQEKFESIGGDVSDDWPFHAAASVMRAHTLLRSFPEVDAGHTAVTGISWGGYTTCLVASLDNRFQAAVPVYGCGFLHEGESVQKPSIDKLGDRRQAWVDAYDPGSLLPRCHVPILFVNGTNDVHYVLDSYMRSFNVVPGPKQMRVTVKMRHGHPPGWAPREIGLFIDSYCRGGDPLPVPGQPRIIGDDVKVEYTARVPLKSAQLHYTTDVGLRSDRDWTSVDAVIDSETITAPRPPANANTWFLTLTDERNATVSTTVQFQQ